MLRLYLEKIEMEIAQHPLASPAVRDSFEIIERVGKDDVEPIARELKERGLPSLDELGKLQLRHSLSWSRLHKKQRKIRQKLAKSSE